MSQGGSTVMEKGHEASGVAMVLAGAAMISFSAVFVKLAHVGPTMAGFYRTFFGGVVLGQGGRLWNGARNFWLSLACGVFFGLDLTFWHRSIHRRGLPRTPASRAGLVLLLQPTLAFVWDVLFFARPTTAVQALGAAGALAAIYLGLTSRR